MRSGLTAILLAPAALALAASLAPAQATTTFDADGQEASLSARSMSSSIHMWQRSRALMVTCER